MTLVEPRGAVNVGHVARLVRNFGVDRLYLVSPMVDMSVAATYASHASAVLDEAVVTSFDRVRSEHELLIATTAVKAKKRSNVIRRTVAPEKVGRILETARTSSLVFGRDTTGLTNEEISMCDVTTTIEASPSYRSLNLGHAVAIILYLVSSARHGGERGRKQSRVAREVFARSLSDLARESQAPTHKSGTLYEAGKRLAASSSLSDRQLNLLTGVLERGTTTIRRLQDGDSKT